MNEFAVQRILARADHGLDPLAAEALTRMATYLDRSSLKIVWDDGGRGDALTIHVSDDAVRYALTVAELRALWLGMKAGTPVDWSTLRRVAR